MERVHRQEVGELVAAQLDRGIVDQVLRRHQLLLGELSMLTARNPTHENLCAIFLTAFCRCGQQSRALEAFAHLRRPLAGRLGVEPSARLRILQRSILTSDPWLELDGPEVGGRVSFPVA